MLVDVLFSDFNKSDYEVHGLGGDVGRGIIRSAGEEGGGYPADRRKKRRIA